MKEEAGSWEHVAQTLRFVMREEVSSKSLVSQRSPLSATRDLVVYKPHGDKYRVWWYRKKKIHPQSSFLFNLFFRSIQNAMSFPFLFPNLILIELIKDLL